MTISDGGLKVKEKRGVRMLSSEDIKVRIMDLDMEFISLYIGNDHLYDFMCFKDFEIFAKKIYSSYKKYKYVFEKGE